MPFSYCPADERPFAASWTREHLQRQHLHFIGVGGVGMSGLAALCAELGATVSGGELAQSDYARHARRSGVAVLADLAPLPEPTTVAVYSTATPADHPALVEASRRDIWILHRSELIARVLPLFTSVAVCGSHGKSTTTAMIGHVLERAGRRPAVLVGALPNVPFQPADEATGMLVLEADESDRSLLAYRPDLAVVTNIDLDHVGPEGGYRDVDDVRGVIAAFCNGAGHVILGPQADDLAPLVTVPATGAAHSSALSGSSRGGRAISGDHMIANAAAALSAVVHLGVDRRLAVRALGDYRGTKRRFQMRGRTHRGALVIDDYAHHPAEVAATIEAARERARGRVWVAFQPHLYSRTSRFGSELLEALAAADIAFVERIYPAREAGTDDRADADWEALVNERSPTIRLATERAHLVETLSDQASAEDVIVTMGAGDVDLIAADLIAPADDEGAGRHTAWST